MKKNKIKIATVFLVLSFLIQIQVSSFEINSILLTIITTYFLILDKGKVYKQDYEVISILVLIIIIGIISAIFHLPTGYDFLKDLFYFSKPVILILLGYFIARKINNWESVFITLIYLGVSYAVYHIVHTLIYTDFNNTTIANIRGINGLSNTIEVFAIALIILGYKYPVFNLIVKKGTKRIFLFLLFISFVLYFSRTMLVNLFILTLGVLGYLKLNMKGLKYGLILLLITIGLFAYLNNTKIDRDGSGIENFLYKLKIAPEEIFSPKLDLNNHVTLWDHWRAYEAYRAIQSLNKSPYSYPFGKGFGALVDLKFKSPLGEEGMRYIPILHNGYIFILYKTGIVGLLLYLLFLFYLYLQSYTKRVNMENLVFSNILSSLSVSLIFSSLIITGLYNTEEVTPILVGIFLYLKTNTNINKYLN